MRKLTVGSLFSGIGGFDLGLERSNGFEIIFQVEIDPFCQKVLAKHWPNVARHGDIRTCGKHNLPSVDVLCGGFPCQPHSLAGKRQASADERDLWGEFYRIICELRPQWVLAENVSGLLSSESGRFFGGVLRDLAKIGYCTEWTSLRASDFGAPHQRERIFIVAYPNSDRQRIWQDEQKSLSQCAGEAYIGLDDPQRYVAHSTSRREWEHQATRSEERAQSFDIQSSARCLESRVCRVSHGIPTGLDRPHRWPARHGEPQYNWEPPRNVIGKQLNRAKRLKALGNAIVPQCVEYVARCVLATLGE